MANAFEDTQHPRDEHGRFITTGGEKLKVWAKARPSREDEKVSRVGEFMRQAKESLARSPSGFTIRPGFAAPTHGTVVSLPTSAGLSLKVEAGQKLSRAALREWVKKAREHLRSHDNSFIGGWRNADGSIYFDVNEIHPREAAIHLGRTRNQEGVFDLDKQEYIPTGGTGA